MHDKYAEFDVNELTIMLSEAFYSNNMEECQYLMQELNWRFLNTSV